jgi:hypothetical protein
MTLPIPEIPGQPMIDASPVLDAGAPPIFPPISASADARMVAGAILEVLAGVRSISDTALALGVTPARYYQLEARALQGLVTACEPRAPGPVSGSGRVLELEQLRAERDRLKAEAARYQTLARLAHSAFGAPLTTASPPPNVDATSALPGAVLRRQRRAAVAAAALAATAKSSIPQRTRKKRTATVRALRLAQRVQGTAVTAPGTGGSTPSTPMPTLPGSQPGG